MEFYVAKSMNRYKKRQNKLSMINLKKSFVSFTINFGLQIPAAYNFFVDLVSNNLNVDFCCISAIFIIAISLMAKLTFFVIALLVLNQMWSSYGFILPFFVDIDIIRSRLFVFLIKITRKLSGPSSESGGDDSGNPEDPKIKWIKRVLCALAGIGIAYGIYKCWFQKPSIPFQPFDISIIHTNPENTGAHLCQFSSGFKPEPEDILAINQLQCVHDSLNGLYISNSEKHGPVLLELISTWDERFLNSLVKINKTTNDSFINFLVEEQVCYYNNMIYAQW